MVTSSQTVFVRGLSAEQKDVLKSSKDQDVEFLNISKVHSLYCERSFSQHQDQLDRRCMSEVIFDIHKNHGGALIDKFIDVVRKDNATFEQESFTLSKESNIEDNIMLPVMCVSAAHKNNYFWNCRKDHSGLFKTMSKKSDFCDAGKLIFTRVIFLVSAVMDLLEVEPAALHHIPFVIIFPQCMVQTNQL